MRSSPQQRRTSARRALRLAVPAGTPGPFDVKNARARGFSAPVRTRATDEDDLLPLELGIEDGA